MVESRATLHAVCRFATRYTSSIHGQSASRRVLMGVTVIFFMGCSLLTVCRDSEQ